MNCYCFKFVFRNNYLKFIKNEVLTKRKFANSFILLKLWIDFCFCGSKGRIRPCLI